MNSISSNTFLMLNRQVVKNHYGTEYDQKVDHIHRKHINNLYHQVLQQDLRKQDKRFVLQFNVKSE